MQIRRIKVRLLKSPVSSTSTCRKSILSQFASHHFHIFVPFNSILCFLFTFSHRAAVIQDSPRIPLYQCPYIFFIQILLHPLFRMLSLRTSLATVVHARTCSSIASCTTALYYCSSFLQQSCNSSEF